MQNQMERNEHNPKNFPREHCGSSLLAQGCLAPAVFFQMLDGKLKANVDINVVGKRMKDEVPVDGLNTDDSVSISHVFFI